MSSDKKSKLNPNCGCPNKGCERHGDCKACNEFHKELGNETYCQKIKPDGDGKKASFWKKLVAFLDLIFCPS